MVYLLDYIFFINKNKQRKKVMLLFLIGIAVLIAGYFTYGKFVEKVLAPDDRETPAVKSPDGVD